MLQLLVMSAATPQGELLGLAAVENEEIVTLLVAELRKDTSYNP